MSRVLNLLAYIAGLLFSSVWIIAGDRLSAICDTVVKNLLSSDSFITLLLNVSILDTLMLCLLELGSDVVRDMCKNVGRAAASTVLSKYLSRTKNPHTSVPQPLPALSSGSTTLQPVEIFPDFEEDAEIIEINTDAHNPSVLVSTGTVLTIHHPVFYPGSHLNPLERPFVPTRPSDHSSKPSKPVNSFNSIAKEFIPRYQQKRATRSRAKGRKQHATGVSAADSKDWAPSQAPAYWTRGGCPTTIKNPSSAPTLNPRAACFVPRAVPNTPAKTLTPLNPQVAPFVTRGKPTLTTRASFDC